MVCSGHFK